MFFFADKIHFTIEKKISISIFQLNQLKKKKNNIIIKNQNNDENELNYKIIYNSYLKKLKTENQKKKKNVYKESSVSFFLNHLIKNFVSFRLHHPQHRR